MEKHEILVIADFFETLFTDILFREEDITFLHVMLKIRFPNSSGQELKQASQYYLRQVERAPSPEPFKSVLKNLPIYAEPKAIKADLELQGCQVISVTQMQKRSTGELLPHFLVEFGGVQETCLKYVIDSLVMVEPIQRASMFMCHESPHVSHIACDGLVKLRCIECKKGHALRDCPQYQKNSRIIQSNNERPEAYRSRSDHRLQATGHKPPPKLLKNMYQN